MYSDIMVSENLTVHQKEYSISDPYFQICRPKFSRFSLLLIRYFTGFLSSLLLRIFNCLPESKDIQSNMEKEEELSVSQIKIT